MNVELNKAMILLLENLDKISTQQLDILGFNIWAEQMERENNE